MIREWHVPKHSISMSGGGKTSISLEDEFWEALREIAKERSDTISGLIEAQKKTHQGKGNFSSRLRCFVLRHYQLKASKL